jgi:predicted nucleotidyltransferase
MAFERKQADLGEVRRYLRNRLQELYGERLCQTLLFGSQARGEAGPESDVDVLVVLHEPVDQYAEYRRLGDLTVDVMERFGVYVSPVLAGEADYLTGDWPLLRGVHEEGIPL